MRLHSKKSVIGRAANAEHIQRIRRTSGAENVIITCSTLRMSGAEIVQVCARSLLQTVAENAINQLPDVPEEFEKQRQQADRVYAETLRKIDALEQGSRIDTGSEGDAKRTSLVPSPALSVTSRTPQMSA